MKKYITICLTVASLFMQMGHAEIFEIEHFIELKEYLQPGTWILLDIAHTLMYPTQELGTGRWLKLQIRQYNQAHIENGTKKAIKEWRAINMLSSMRIVEEGSDQIVQYLQKQGYPIMAVTKAGLTVIKTRTEQLNNLGFDFTITAPHPQDLYLNKPVGMLYRQGILFTESCCKGGALLAFFDRINQMPSHILMIDDKKQNLEDVEAALKGVNTTFTGLRYSYLDEHKASFNPQIANIEFEKSNFSHILSDIEAAALLAPTPTLEISPTK